jgi:parallel beta-helix repeat protein
MFGMTHATYAATFCVSTPDELQIALTTAAFNGEDDEVQIVQGTYVGNFVFVSAEGFDLSIEGGNTAGCASRVVDPTNTVLNANSSGNVLILVGNSVADFVIDGLTVQNGNATDSSNSSSGGGLYIKTAEGEVTLSNNLISGNQAKEYGGGAYIEGAATVTLTDNDITGNTAKSYYGGGVYFAEKSAVTLTGNDINGNTANRYGGGVYFGENSTGTFTDNDITGNTAKYNSGGGVSFGSSSTGTFTDNVISDNTASSGGSVYFGSSSTGTLTDNDINGNTASYGGGVYFESSSTVTLTDNDISDNTANYSGGGVYFARNSTGTLTGNDISGNTAKNSYGGGVYFDSSSTGTLTSNVINGNTANSSGGGVSFAGNSTGTLTGNDISGNTAKNSSGGGVYFAENSAGTLTDNDITGNTAKNDGGGVYFGSSSTRNLIINNVISANTVNGNGGGLYIQPHDATILTNNTISNNDANNGGGVWLKLQDDTDSADIYNNIIWNNSAVAKGNDLYINNDGNTNFIPSPLNLFNNDFDQSFSGSHIAIPILIDSSNLNKLDPLFVDDEDYHLQASSPCIDTGDNAAPSLPSTDKDGNPRIVNSIVDIGAYEQQVAADSYLQFSKANYSVKENKNTVTITATRTDGSSGAVSVDYATSDETATAGSDYTETSGTLNWADGDASKKTFTVDIIDDSEVEGDETLILSLGNATGGAGLGEPDTAVLTITDDDSTTFNCKSVTEIPKKECKALIALYDSTDGENWLDNTGWNVTNTPCSWNGVTCQDGHVTRLSLKDNNLKGSISEKFFKLKKLKSLTLSGNEIDASILKTVKKFKSLTVLLLNNCKLSGKIPNSLMKLKELDVLDLKDNCLKTKVSNKLKKWLDGLNPGWDESQTGCFY